MKQVALATRWEGADLVVMRHHEEVDRIADADIRRVLLVCHGADTPSDLEFAIIETATEHVLLPADSGIAGRVYFERQPYWTERACIHWVTGRHAPLPRHLCPGIWLLRRHRPAYLRLPASELASLIAQWPVEGPQTWEQRKWAQNAAKRHRAAQARSIAPGLS
jgi:hypothetical protein